MAEHSSMTRKQVEDALEGVLMHLMSRAEEQMNTDATSPRAVELALQYQAVSEAVLYLGTQLIAFEDIEAEDDVDGESELKN